MSSLQQRALIDEEILAKGLALGQMFEDPSFPASAKSLFPKSPRPHSGFMFSFRM